MKAYNPKHWFSLIFSFHKTDSFRQLLPGMFGLALLSGILCYIDVELKLIAFRSTTVMHSLLGFVISLLLVFRTNTAYDRWWEGRRLFGDLVNNSRNLMLKYNAIIPDSSKELKDNFRILISNYTFALKEHLRGGFIQEQLEEHPVLRTSMLKGFNHVPNRIASQLYSDSEKLVRDKIITEEKLLLINEELRSFTNVAGACERIRKTPIPYSYSSFIKRMIFLYVITLPLGLIHDLKWATIPIVLFVFYAFASLELIAEEIEDPFGQEQNDLPTDEIANTIKKNLQEITR
ncbi:MAG TPA: bestrophin family ion channel [Bacteroidia bacterium]|jgi:putative membrane protein